MSVPVTVQLTIKTVTFDFVNNGVRADFNLSKFGQPQSAVLEVGGDITQAQLNTFMGQIELIFAKWVARQ